MKSLILENKEGSVLLQVMIYSAIAIILLTGFLGWATLIAKMATLASDRVQAFMIAEAGIEYYRWHLAHAPQDFKDGTETDGPYIHIYYDKNGIAVGEFSLDITPPLVGSTIVTIRSTGKTYSNPGLIKIIQVRMGVPSFAKYAVVLDKSVRFGQGTEVFGPIHSNGGVRFDGLAHNSVTSGLNDYNDADHSGANEYGVHTHVNAPPGTGINNTFRPLEAPPNEFASRTDIFLAGREIGIPSVNFAGISQNFSQMQSDSLNGGFHASSSGSLGYEIILKTDDTFDLYKVTKVRSSPSQNCTDSKNQSSNQGGWGTWSVQNKSLLGNYGIPANGIIFLEDDIWVRGQISGARVTIASARFPLDTAPKSSITMDENLLYTNYDGQDTISLIAQYNVNIGLYSADIIRVDGALVAQNGRVGRYYYNAFCGSSSSRSAITTFGMIASNIRYGFAYTGGSGYAARNLVYDTNLLYAPPPSFPLTPDAYQIISWEEIR